VWFPIAYLNQISMIAVGLINHDPLKFHEQQLGKYNDISLLHFPGHLYKKSSSSNHNTYDKAFAFEIKKKKTSKAHLLQFDLLKF